MTEELWLFAVLTGIAATARIGLWAGILKLGLHLPKKDRAMVGRWFGHMPGGVRASKWGA